MTLAARLRRAFVVTPIAAAAMLLFLIPVLPTISIHCGNEVAGIIVESAIPVALMCWLLAAICELIDGAQRRIA